MVVNQSCAAVVCQHVNKRRVVNGQFKHFVFNFQINRGWSGGETNLPPTEPPTRLVKTAFKCTEREKESGIRLE